MLMMDKFKCGEGDVAPMERIMEDGEDGAGEMVEVVEALGEVLGKNKERIKAK